jgi:cation:H+ antiporter
MHLPPLPLAVLSLVFMTSLLVTMGASALFARTLEAISDMFDLSTGLLSLLSALGANIPNYTASIVAIVSAQFAVGLGIIIGSNIYNIAIILAISTFATPSRQGIALTLKEARDARLVGVYTLAIMLTVLLGVWLLSLLPPGTEGHTALLLPPVLLVTNILTLSIFAALSHHALHRVTHIDETATHTAIVGNPSQGNSSLLAGIRTIAGTILALGIALGGVIVMVQSGQEIAVAVHMPPAILGLLVLAVATSLPNTVVAFTLARTHRATACVEEVLSSNSINATLGVALPLLIWHDALHDRLLVLLDTPLMVALTLVALLCVMRRRVGHRVALALLVMYAVWVGVHMLA